MTSIQLSRRGPDGASDVTPDGAMPAKVVVESDGRVIVGDTAYDLSAAPVGAELVAPLPGMDDGVGVMMTRAAVDRWDAVVEVCMDDDAPSPDWGTVSAPEVVEFPTYVLWPKGEDHVLPKTAGAETGEAARRDAIRARIAEVADSYDHERDFDDPDDPDARQSNTRTMSRSVIGWAWWLTVQWEAGAPWDPDATEVSVAALTGTTVTDWESLADWAATELERRIALEHPVKSFYWSHDPDTWSGYFAPEPPDVRLPLADWTGAVVHTTASESEWDAITGAHYAAAQAASVGVGV